MSKPDHSGPAFPSGIQPSGYASEGPAFEYGMTLRDYFAAQYLCGLGSNPSVCGNSDDIAEECYEIADAMLKARSGHGRPSGEA